MSAATLEKGNWRKFDSFAWHDRPDDCEEWAIVYTHNRDSDILDMANAETIGELMAPHLESGDAIQEHHSHWACGWVDGYAIRPDSPAAVTWRDIQERLADYPILDEDTYSRMEHDAQGEAWDNWARSEFAKGLEKQYGELDIPEDKLKDLFDEWANWDTDSGGVYCDVGNVIGRIVADDIRAYCPVRAVKVYRNGEFYCTGTLQFDEYAADCPLDAPEFAVCIDAIIEGADSIEIDGFTWTWELT